MSPRNTFAATRRSHAILQRLRQGEGMTIRQVSDEFGIQYPQARADLKLLEELYDLDTYRDGRIKVWEIPGAGDSRTHVGMAAALELGGVALDIFKHTPYGERIDSLADEWRDRVRPAQRDRLRRLSMALVLRRTWLPTRPERMLEVLEELLDCIALRRGVEIVYERADGEIGPYLLIPRRLIWYQDRLWLQAIHDGAQKLFDLGGVIRATWCSRQDLIEALAEPRLAALDDDPAAEGVENPEQEEGGEDDEAISRHQMVMQEVADAVDQWFQYGSREEEDAYFADAFGIYADNYEVETVELRVRNSWANYLRRYRLHPSQKNQEIDDGLDVHFQIGICPEFKSFILGMIPDVEIISPTWLRRELLDSTREWME